LRPAILRGMSDDNLRIVRVQCDELDPGPLPVPFQDSTMGPFTHWKLGWLRITADDGTLGEGPGLLPESIIDLLLTEGPRTPQQWWHRLFWVLRNNGHRNPATSGPLYGLDMAMRDILARRAGQPWHRYMGARRDSVPVYGSGGGTNATLDQLVADMTDMVRCGFTTLKMKVGTNFGTQMESDAERVGAVREAIGAHIKLAIDGNQTWSAEQAIAFARRVAKHDIAWFEEPVHSADRHATRDVVRGCPFPVAMGESENHWLGFRDLLECGVQHLQPSPHCLPGFDRWRDAVAFSDIDGATWSAGGYSHLTAMYIATRPDGMVEFLRSIVGHWSNCWATKPKIENGTIALPSTPGLAVAVDWDGLAARNAIRSVVDRRA